jgi:hypothetical protein
VTEVFSAVITCLNANNAWPAKIFYGAGAGSGAGAMEVDEEDEEIKKALLMSVGKDPAAAKASGSGGAAGGGSGGAASTGEKVPVAEKVSKEILDQLVDMVGCDP